MKHYEIEIFADGRTFDVIGDQKYLISAMTFRTDKQAVSDWYEAHRVELCDCETYEERYERERKQKELLDEWKRRMTELLGWESEHVVFDNIVSEVFTAVLIEEVKTP